MEWHAVNCQGLENVSDIDLGAAGETEMNMQKFQVDKLSQDDEDLFSWRREPGRIGALINGINNEIDSPLRWEFEHALQAFQESIQAGLSGAIIVGGIDR